LSPIEHTVWVRGIRGADMSLRCGNEAEDSPNFDARGSLRATKKETNCFAFSYELETPEEDWGVRSICTVKVIGGKLPIGNPVRRTDRGRYRISSCVTEVWCD